jgi:hypothetical protein
VYDFFHLDSGIEREPVLLAAGRRRVEG